MAREQPVVTVTGIGGVFFRAEAPDKLAAWYEETFGITDPAHSPWQTEAGTTVFAPFDQATDYFGSKGQWAMFNFRVADLDAALTGLAEVGVPLVKDVETMDGVGRFAWVVDPEGNRIELWEPVATSIGSTQGA